MTRRGFRVLCLLTLAAVAGAVAVQVAQPAPDRPTLDGEKVFPALAGRLDAVARIAVTTPEGGFTLVREGGREGNGWIAASAGGYPAREDRINALLVELSALELLAPKTARPALYSRLGVAPPESSGAQSRRVTLYDRDGAVLADLIVGKQRHTRTGRRDQGTYVRRPDSARAYLAAGLIDLSDTVYPWLDSLVLDIAPERVRRVEITRPGGGRLLAIRPERGAPAMGLAGLSRGDRPDVAEVRKLPRVLEGVRFDAVRRRESVSLPAPRAVAEVATFDGLRVRLRVYRHAGADWLTLTARAGDGQAGDGQAQDGATARTDAARLTRRGAGWRYEGWAYKVAPYLAERLSQSLPDLLVQE